MCFYKNILVFPLRAIYIEKNINIKMHIYGMIIINLGLLVKICGGILFIGF